MVIPYVALGVKDPPNGSTPGMPGGNEFMSPICGICLIWCSSAGLIVSGVALGVNGPPNGSTPGIPGTFSVECKDMSLLGFLVIISSFFAHD